MHSKVVFGPTIFWLVFSLKGKDGPNIPLRREKLRRNMMNCV